VVHVVVEDYQPPEVGDRLVAAAPPRGLAGYGVGSTCRTAVAVAGWLKLLLVLAWRIEASPKLGKLPQQSQKGHRYVITLGWASLASPVQLLDSPGGVGTQRRGSITSEPTLFTSGWPELSFAGSTALARLASSLLVFVTGGCGCISLFVDEVIVVDATKPRQNAVEACWLFARLEAYPGLTPRSPEGAPAGDHCSGGAVDCTLPASAVCKRFPRSNAAGLERADERIGP